MKKWPWLVFYILVLALYLLTLQPSMMGGDSGEFFAAACSWGVAHPPGYPLYTLLSNLMPWSLLNAFSAITSAAAVTVLAYTLFILSGGISAVTGGLLLALAPTFWVYSISAEVFSLHILLLSLLVFYSVQLARSSSDEDRLRYFYRLVFVATLGMAHHHTLIFISAPLCVWAWRQVTVSSRSLFKALGLVIFGLSFYVYLPLAAWLHPNNPISWGQTDTLSGFLKHFFRSEYGTFQLVAETANSTASATKNFSALREYLLHLKNVLTLPLVFLALWGAFWSYKKNLNSKMKSLFLTWIAAFLFYVVVFHSLVNFTDKNPMQHAILERFWLQADYFLFLWIGLAISLFYSQRWIRIALSVIVVILSLNSLVQNNLIPKKNNILETYAKAVLTSLPENSILLTRGDQYANSFLFSQICQKTRPDVVVMDLELLTYTWYSQRMQSSLHLPGWAYNPHLASGFSMRDLLDNLKSQSRRVFLVGSLNEQDTSLKDHYHTLPNAFIKEIVPITQKEVASEIHPQTGDLGNIFQVLQFAPGSWEHPIVNEVSQWRRQQSKKQ